MQHSVQKESYSVQDTLGQHCVLDSAFAGGCWQWCCRVSRHQDVHKQLQLVQDTLGHHSELDNAFADCY